jgi:hypothetical protein
MEEALWKLDNKKINCVTDTYQRCCIIVTIYCGSGASSVLEKFPFRFRIHIRNRVQIISSTVFPQKFFLQNLAFLIIEAWLSSHFLQFDFCIPVYVGTRTESGNGTGTGMGSGFGSAKEISCGSCGSGSTNTAYQSVVLYQSYIYELLLRIVIQRTFLLYFYRAEIRTGPGISLAGGRRTNN